MRAMKILHQMLHPDELNTFDKRLKVRDYKTTYLDITKDRGSASSLSFEDVPPFALSPTLPRSPQVTDIH